MIKKGDIDYVIDVRTTTEWKLGHYPGVEHIPTDRITKINLKNYRKIIKIKHFLFIVILDKEQDLLLKN